MINRIKWYGPTLVLLLTTIVILLAGPSLVRQIAWAQTDAKLDLQKQALANNQALVDLSQSFRRVAEVVEPSVVSIERYSRIRHEQNTSPFDEMLRRRFGIPEENLPRNQQKPDGDMERYNVPQVDGNGSGWVFDKQGHIVTNHHVIEGADELHVKFKNGTERIATVVGSDPRTDVAVLKVEGDDLHPATLATEPVEKGDIVFAFGSPLHFEFTMSQGIVSAKGRQLGILNRRGEGGEIIAGFEDFIQTDAAINPGNSGGPLANIYGQVVGMNSAIATRTGVFSGLGFAIPVKMVKGVVEQIIANGKVTRGFLGIAISELDPRMARTFGFEGKGVLVEKPIEDTPAAAAGIQRGDIIVKLNDKPVETVDALRQRIAGQPPGTPVTLEVFRNGKIQKFEISLAELPDATASAGPQKQAGELAETQTQILRKLGIDGTVTFSDALARQMDVPFVEGVLVRSVRRGSVAASEGLAPGTVITHVMNVSVKNVEELANELAKHDLAKGVRISVTEPVSGISRFILLELRE